MTDKSDPVLKLVDDTIKINKQAIVFANTKNSAEKAAEDIAKSIDKKYATKELEQISSEILEALSTPTKQCKRLAKAVKKGIAFHHAGLNHKQRDIIESNFKKKIIKVICATPTLAMGCDLPAYRVILKNLRRYGHRGLSWIPTLEYLQMAGRAGRPKYDSIGQAIAIANTKEANDEIKDRYINGLPEDIYSKLAVEPVLRTYILSLIATGFVNNEESIINFFSKTFWAHQYKDIERLKSIIQRMLGLLEEFDFIISSESKDDDFMSADEIQNYRYKATPIGKRVAELYIDPLTANHLIKGLNRSEKKKIDSFSLLQLVSHTLEMRPLLRIKAKEHEMIQGKLIEYSESIIDLEPTYYDSEYEDFINSIKTAVFMQDWIDEKDEEFILKTYSVRPGEIKYKLDTADWLLYASEELSRINKKKDILKEIIKTRLRIKHGAKEELLALLQLKNIGRKRARKLFNARIRDMSEIKKADITTLAQLLGDKIAIDIKKQVGQDIKVVPKTKRTGQLSLDKF